MKEHQTDEMFNKEDIKKFKDVTTSILAYSALVGGISLALFMPGLAKVAGPLLLKKVNKRERRYKKERLIQYARSKRAIYYLRQRGLLEVEENAGEKCVRVTKKGLEYLHILKRKATSIDINQVWNGKWWAVASDIPSKSHRKEAEIFRKKLKSLGFYSLQKSLWIFPFNPIIELNAIAKSLDILSFVTIMKVEKLEVADKKKLMKFFYFLK